MSFHIKTTRFFYHARNINSHARKFVNINRKTSLETETKIRALLSVSSIKNAADIDNLKSQLSKLTEKNDVKNVHSLVLNEFFHLSKYNCILNYIKYLDEASKSKMNLYLTNLKFKTYYFKETKINNALTESEKNEILTEYKKLRQAFPLLDSSSIENCILAISLTKNWSSCIELLEELKEIDKPSGRCYSAIISSIFLNGNDEIAWKYFEEMFANNRMVLDEIYSSYLQKLDESVENKTVQTKLEKLFKECTEKNLIFSEKIAVKLNNLLNDKNISTATTHINNHSKCANCGQKLESFKIDNETFNNLKQKIIDNVIIGKNIFTKTTPEEFGKFQNFIKSLRDFNVVIDGLNVAYTAGTKQSPKIYSTLLGSVINHFINQNKKVVVLGRIHMLKWPKNNWKFTKSNPALFLTQDISQDDPYLLYTALHCGKDTIIVTRDLMRSHSFLLKDPNDKITFSRWLAQRQYQLNYVRNDGKVFFKIPPPHCRIIQKNGEHWHVPYNPESENGIKNSWLCIKM